MNNLKLIGRNLFKQSQSSFYILINFVIAFTCVTLIYLFVTDEFAFDRHFSKFDSIYRLNMQAKDKCVTSCNFPAILHGQMDKVTNIEKVARLQTFMGERNIVINNQVYVSDKFLFGDPEILEIFDFEFLLGNSEDALSKPFNLIISQSIARKYFGKSDPLGKIIQTDNHNFNIAAVVKDLPEQSHFAMNFLAPVSSYNIINSDLMTKWYISAFNYYFTVLPKADKSKIETQITKLFAEGNGIEEENIEFGMELEPLANIHLRSVGTRWDNAIKGDIKVVYGFITIALLILGIAIANYINVLTASYQRKVRENSIRKINGATEFSVISFQVGETLFFLLISMTVAIFMVYLLLPLLNNLSGKNLNPHLLVSLTVGIILIAITSLSVIYPVLFMQSFKTTELLKNRSIILNLHKQKKHFMVRGSLVTFQLVIAIILIASTLIIYKQLHLITKAKTGFDQENTLVVINPYSEKMNQRYDLFKEKLSAIPTIKSVAVTQNAPADYINNFTPVWLPGFEKESKVDLGQITVDHDFIPAVGANIIKGKNFDKNILYDEQMGVVINESAVKALNLTDPIGQKLVVQNNAYTPNNEMEIIGVVEDMQYFTLKEASKPIMYFIRPWGYHNIIISLEKGDYQSTLRQIEQTWKEAEPVLPFKYQFMDDRINNNYTAEINTAKITTILSAVAIFLSVLGILGMIIFTIQQRVNEICIRKVNGAKISEILAMLNKDFVKWVVVAFVIATPVACYAMTKWLENFAYKTELSWWIFALAGLLALGIALLTVSWQSWKAATRNPVEALRYE
ncbi:ABC transporter permease [Gaoshiqia sp. Z1-71]|uniref:ABC transporter permease n=1 Tax=Gaoshiqia hydrogeniformans TaxID=3290090 RepID=UPI003BF7EB48